MALGNSDFRMTNRLVSFIKDNDILISRNDDSRDICSTKNDTRKSLFSDHSMQDASNYYQH